VDSPPFDKSAMDGFAVRAEDIAAPPVTLAVIADIPAGTMPRARIGAGQAASIMTGAPVPEGADSVVMVEWTSGFGGKEVTVERAVRAGANVSKRGRITGRGDVVVEQGTRIGVEEAALLAMVGADPVPVFELPRVALIATGDELVPPSATPGPAQIRNCASVALRAFFKGYGIDADDLGAVGDSAEATREALEKALDRDIVVLTGGVSVGTYDFVQEVLEALGVDVYVTRVAVKPGKPTVFGTLGDKMIFGLPGNPVSTMVISRVLLGPALEKRLGLRPSGPRIIQARLRGDMKKRPDRLWFVPAHIDIEKEALVSPIPNHGSADIPSAAAANCLIVGPKGETLIKSGSSVAVFLLGDRL
jgi:molybdopterin molybdotransferase